MNEHKYFSFGTVKFQAFEGLPKSGQGLRLVAFGLSHVKNIEKEMNLGKNGFLIGEVIPFCESKYSCTN